VLCFCMKPIIVIPTYNEKDNITRLLQEIFAIPIFGLEVVIVDDNSPDGTAAVVQETFSDYPVHIIRREKKLGLGSAYIVGFKQALALGATHIFQMDADFSHDPKDVPRLLSAAKKSDVVIGSRRVAGGRIVGWNIVRHCTSFGATVLARLFLGIVVKDVTAGFRCIKKEVLLAINLDGIKSQGYAFQEELLLLIQKKGFSITEIPVTFVDRKKGKSKLGIKEVCEFFLTLTSLRRNKKHTQ